MKICSQDDDPLARRAKTNKDNLMKVLFWALFVATILSLLYLFIPRRAQAQVDAKPILVDLLLVKPKEKQMPVGEKVTVVTQEQPVLQEPMLTTPTQVNIAPVYSGDVWELGHKLCVARFGEAEWIYFNDLVDRESGWNPQATNSSSGAFGLGQALPASKMSPYGDINNPETQIRWMMDYVAERYNLPSNAIAFHNSHNWY